MSVVSGGTATNPTSALIEATWRDMQEPGASGEMPDWFVAAAGREIAVLSWALLRAEVIDDLSFLDRKHFLVTVYGKVWAAMRDLRERGDAVTPAAVARAAGVSARDMLGLAWASQGSLLLQVQDYAEEMVRTYHAVCVRKAATAAAASAGDADLRRITETVEEAREATARLTAIDRSFTSSADAASELMQAMERRRLSGEPPGATTGLAYLDDLIGGLKPATMTVIGGRPGMGKSVLASSIAMHTARAGNGVAFFSLELSREMQTARFVADEASSGRQIVAYEDILRGRLRADEIRMVNTAAEGFAGLPIDVCDRANLTVAEIRGIVKDARRRLAARGADLAVVVLDYLKFIRASDRYAGSRPYEIGEITAALRGMAKDFGVAVLLVAQVNRQNEGRENKRPQLADLRESGDIENDADVVMFVYRDEYYARQETDEVKRLERLEASRDQMEILVEKNRFGRTDTVKVWCSVAAAAVRNLEARF